MSLASPVLRVFVDGHACVPWGWDLFQVSEQFHEPCFIRITYGRLTIWLHPFRMLDSEVVMNLPPKLGVSMDFVSHRHCLGENSSAQPNGSSKATATSSTNCGAMSARQGPGECSRETLGELASFLALAS